MPTLSTTLLTDLIRRKHDVLVELCAVGRRQREIVERGETTALLELLAAKQTMIALLQQVERDLAPFHAENPDQRIWVSADDRQQCAEQAAECNRLLAEVVELERASAERLAVRRNDVAAQLRQVYAAGQARDAYEAQR
jgi:flagellar biosynthesis/type III secretory pathway chaperone